MGHISNVSKVSLALNWTKSRVQQNLDNAEREELVRFLHERYTERFFNPIRVLRQAPGNYRGFGFAIIALCCLLIETLQCYREGLPSSHKKELRRLEASPLNAAAPPDYKLKVPLDAGSGGVFCRFFKQREHQKFLPGVDGTTFYEEIRCGLLHQAQTKNGWRIVSSGKFWDPPIRSLGRDEFSQRLEECFTSYLQDLKGELIWDEDIWKAARKKIWWLIQLSSVKE
jgi:hypothetical protein